MNVLKLSGFILLFAAIISSCMEKKKEAKQHPGHRTANFGFGTSIEQIQPSDADGKGSIGNFIHTSNSWTETNGMLMAMEITGIYLQTDKTELYEFDQVEQQS